MIYILFDEHNKYIINVSSNNNKTYLKIQIKDVGKCDNNLIKKQRNVNNLLGKNHTRNHDIIYNEIMKKIGNTKICNFGHVRGSKTGVKHLGDKNVSIYDFELRGTHIDENNNVNIKGCGLQSFCKVCSTRRRHARIKQSRSEIKGFDNKDIYENYIKKYGKNKKCSRCGDNKQCFNFNISKSMECHLHNTCKQCSNEYGESVGDRWIIYMPDGNFKYNKNRKKKSHDDHIFPLSLGGTNEKQNHQLITPSKNLEKSDSIAEIVQIENIPVNLLSERYRFILKNPELKKI